MSTTVGILHDYPLDNSEATSETDAGSKYSVQSTKTSTEENENAAELTVVDFDKNQSLDVTNGMNVKCMTGGAL